jgi:hypothetical protein
VPISSAAGEADGQGQQGARHHGAGLVPIVATTAPPTDIARPANRSPLSPEYDFLGILTFML